jgi:hypothetical protein
MPFEVVGVFAGQKLQQRSDLDGEPLTPVTFPREVSTEMTEVEVDALESSDDVREFQSRYQHIPADLTMIIPYRSLLAAGGHLKGRYDELQRGPQYHHSHYHLGVYCLKYHDRQRL